MTRILGDSLTKISRELEPIPIETQQFSVAIQSAVTEEIQRCYDSEGISGVYKAEAHSIQTDEAGRILTAHGITEATVQATAAPAIRELDILSEKDWQDIHGADEQFLALWSRTNRRRAELAARGTKQLRHEKGLSFGPEDELGILQDDALLHALPLLHGTSLSALAASIARGEFCSNRTLIDEGVGSKFGNTFEEDRMLGLDNFVFADFGRPHYERAGASQAEVTVVISPDALHQPGTFVTQNDLLWLEAKYGSRDMFRSYLTTLALPEDFYATATARVYQTSRGHGVNQYLSMRDFARGLNGDLDQTGVPSSFSTWEIKLPDRTSTDYVARLIFKNASQCEQFQAMYGTQRFDCVVEGNLSEALSRGEDILGTQERYERELQTLIDKDYEIRLAVVQATPETERQTEYVRLLDFAAAEGGTHYNPDWITIGFHNPHHNRDHYNDTAQLISDIREEEQSLSRFRKGLAFLLDNNESEHNEPPVSETLVIGKAIRANGAVIIDSVLTVPGAH